MISRKTFALIGVIIGFVTIIIGIVFMATPPESFSTHSVGTARFGGDYYTEEYAATKAASDNAAIVANNIRELGKANARYAGTFFIILGLIVILFFGEKYDVLVHEPAVQGSLNSESAPMNTYRDQ